MVTKTTVTNIKATEQAAQLADVQIVEKTEIGSKAIVVIKFKHPEQLIKLGEYTALIEASPFPKAEVKQEADLMPEKTKAESKKETAEKGK